MPAHTPVHRCVNKLKDKPGVNAYAVCQSSTGQSFATGKPLKGKKAMPIDTPPGKRPPGVPPTMPDAETSPGGVPPTPPAPAPGAGASPAPPPDTDLGPEGGMGMDTAGGMGYGPESGMGGEPEPNEPYSAQVVRRLAGDLVILLHEYDGMMTHLEHPEIKEYLDTRLRNMVEELGLLEQVFSAHHSGLPPLEHNAQGFEQYAGQPEPVEGEGEIGEEPETEAGLESGAPTEEEAEEEAGEIPPKKKTPSEEAEPVGADSEEEELPDEEEAVEGMRTKALIQKYGKAMNGDGRTSQEMARRGKSKPNRKIFNQKGIEGVQAGRDDDAVPTDLPSEGSSDSADAKPMPKEVTQPSSGLMDHHREGISNAIGDLSNWVQNRNEWTDKHRFEAYHHGKTLDDIADRLGKYKQMPGGDEAPDAAVGGTPAEEIGGETKCITGTEFAPKPENELQSKLDGLPTNELSQKFKDIEGNSADMVEIVPEPEPHPYHQTLKDAGKFFVGLSNAHALTDEHVFEAARHHQGLDQILRSASDHVGVQGSDDVSSPEIPSTEDVPSEMGSMGSKSLDDMEKLLDDRHSEMVELNNKIIAIYNRVPTLEYA